MIDVCLTDGSILVVSESLTEIQLLASTHTKIELHTIVGCVLVDRKHILDLRDHVEIVG